MLGFVVALKSKAKSKNWTADSRLVKRTVLSLLNQKDKNFKIYIAHTDLPDDPVQHPQVEWIPFPFPYAQMDDIADREVFLTRYGLGHHLPNLYDQGKKSLYASSFARRDGCRYVMSVDYDDLISNRIAGFVNNADATKNHGWYMDKGYIYKEGDSYLMKVNKINGRCGSVNIVRMDYVPEPDFSTPNYQDIKFFSVHAFIPQWLKIDYDVDIPPVPFTGLIYLIHNTNWYNTISSLKENKIKGTIKRIIWGRPLTRSIKKEFGLYKLPK